MKSGNVTIEATAYELGDHRISSSSMEERLSSTMQRLKIPRGTIAGLTGILERRFWDAGTMPSDVATLAARKVIEQSGIDPAQIGCLINTSVSKDYIEPSVACLVHGNLGLSPTCINYDIGNACLGFVNALVSMTLMIEAGIIRYGMIVDGEGSQEAVEATLARLESDNATEKDFRDNFATLTLGSGAVAMLLTHKRFSRTGHVINGEVTRAATQHSRLCLGQPDRMIADAHGVLIHGVALAHETWQQANRELKNWSDDAIDLYIPHQVSRRNMDALTRTLGLPLEKFHLNFPTLGNIGPAALPITLAQAEEAGRTGSGDHIALMGIGSGLNCTMMSVTW
ncbi:MAG: 3-oxoacyl-ACP synthase III [Desulfobacterales bacterium]|nr:3-oxoacyl-ACP synthase III [Desulfobacterales bacterium]MCF8078787.1 3-oxoacyl-ACP synthase III [Desulfobacterales bacterium]